MKEGEGAGEVGERRRRGAWGGGGGSAGDAHLQNSASIPVLAPPTRKCLHRA